MRKMLVSGALVGAAVMGMACAAAVAETLIVSNRGDGTVQMFDTGSKEEVAKIEVGLGAHEFAVSPDGETVVGSCYGSGPGHQIEDNRLFVIDVLAGKHRAIDLGDNPRPNDLRFVGDGRELVVTSEVRQRVLRVDVAEGKVVASYEHGQPAGHMLAADKKGERVYVPCVFPGEVVVIDTLRGAVEKVIETALGSEGVDLSPDGRRLWVANNRSESISVIDTEKLEVVKSMPTDGFPFRVRFTPDGERVVIAHPGSNDVRVYDAETVEEVGRVVTGGQPTCMALSGDGSRAFVVCGLAKEIAEIDLREMEVVHRYKTGDGPDAVAISPLELEF